MDPAFEAQIDDQDLNSWRRQATDVVIVASVVLHLPVVALYVIEYYPTMPLPISVAILGSYSVIVAAAVLRGINYKVRVWASLGAIYTTAAIGILAFPQGPYVRLLPIVAPIFAIGVLGIRAARIATILSAVVLLSTPILHSVPAVLHVVGSHLLQIPMPAWLNWVQATALTAEMAIVMVLLERSYGFLLTALAAKGRAIADEQIANSRLEAEMHERLRLEREVARISDDERRQLGNDIHDGICQQLTGALLRCQALELRLDQGARPTSGDLEAISSLLSDSIDEAHSVAHGLWPLEPAPEALVSALRRLTKKTRKISGVTCEFRSGGETRVGNPNTAQHLYRIAQEALSNAVRHARADTIQVELIGSGESLTLVVEDNGIGIDGEVNPEGMGLRTMTRRAQIMESDLSIESGPSRGTRVQCSVPMSRVNGTAQQSVEEEFA